MYYIEYDSASGCWQVIVNGNIVATKPTQSEAEEALIAVYLFWKHSQDEHNDEEVI